MMGTSATASPSSADLPAGIADMIRFLCPGCRTVLQVPAHLAGQVVTCGSCQRPLHAPAPPARRPPPAPRRAARPKRPGSRPVLVVALVGALVLPVLGGIAGAVLFSGAPEPEPVASQEQKQKPPTRPPSAKPKGTPKPKEQEKPKDPPRPPDTKPAPKARPIEERVLAAVNAARARAG